MNKLTHLPWDSAHFGYKIGRCDIESAVISWDDLRALARSESYDLLYLFTSEPIATLSPADIKIVCEKRALPRVLNGYVRSYQETYVSEDLLALAYESGKYSRFLLESHFTQEQFESMYAQWITQCVEGELADDVLVYLFEERIIGFLAYKKQDEGYTDIKLIAVHPQYGKMGVATSLLHCLENLTLALNLNYVRTTTQQTNSVACGFYFKNDFTTIQTTYIYHYWL